jgi:hypothetical protein
MMNQEQYLGAYRYDSYKTTVETARGNNHQHWIGEIPVVLPALKFFNEIRYKRPDLVPRVDCKRNGAAYGGVGLAFKDATDIPVGSIFVEDDKDGKLLYCVASDRIKNEKFNDYRPEYHVKKTKDFAKAVKTALQFLRPYSVQDVMDDKEPALAGALAKLKDEPENKLYKATSMGKRTIREEIDNMIRSGYVPATQEFKESIQLMVEQGEELKRITSYNPKRTFVWVKPDRVEYQPHTGVPVVAYKLDDVPEDIRNKVAVLQIGEEGHAVMDVGVKVTPTTFWVFE